jgi:hypothetical protein
LEGGWPGSVSSSFNIEMIKMPIAKAEMMRRRMGSFGMSLESEYDWIAMEITMF